jgi:hypothetical protein
MFIHPTQNRSGVCGRDALLFFKRQAKIFGALCAPAGFEFFITVNAKKLLFGRLVVDAVETIKAQFARLFVFSASEDAGGDGSGFSGRGLAVLDYEAKGAAHVFYVPDDLYARAGLRRFAQEAFMESELALDVHARLKLGCSSFPVGVETKAQNIRESKEGLSGSTVLERNHLRAAVAVKLRG